MFNKTQIIQNKYSCETKKEPDKSIIIRPTKVSHLLEFLKYDDNVIVASYLYDFVKNVKYMIEDIRKEFSQNIASLVISTTKPYKVLS